MGFDEWITARRESYSARDYKLAEAAYKAGMLAAADIAVKDTLGDRSLHDDICYAIAGEIRREANTD